MTTKKKAGLILVLLLCSLTIKAEFGGDVHIQADRGSIAVDTDNPLFREIKDLIGRGYPASYVMLRGVSLGVTIDDLTYLAISTSVDRAREIYDTAISLLPSLPGWACHSASAENRYDRGYRLEDLDTGSASTNSAGIVDRVAGRYFDDGKVLIPFPDWKRGEAHARASIQELKNLRAGDRWYVVPGDADDQLHRPVFVSLYRNSKQIVVDDNYGQLDKALTDGETGIDVVFVFNEDDHIPVSQLGENPRLKEVATEYFSDNKRLTSVPDWQAGEYHALLSIEELREVFELPDRDAIDPDQWAELEEEIRQNGFKQPMQVTLLKNASQAWLDQMERAVVAESLGMESVPGIFFYHGLNRLACGEEASCEDQICNAAIAAGGDASVCGASGEGSATIMKLPSDVNHSSRRSQS